MGLIGAIKAGLEEIFASTASKVAVDEIKAWSPWLASRITTSALKRLPEHCRDRYKEEWASHIGDVPGNIGKLCVAIGFYVAAREIAGADPNYVPAFVWLIWFVLFLTMPFIKFFHLLNDKIILAVEANAKWTRFKLVRTGLISPLLWIGVRFVGVLLSAAGRLTKLTRDLPKDLS